MPSSFRDGILDTTESVTLSVPSLLWEVATAAAPELGIRAEDVLVRWMAGGALAAIDEIPLPTEDDAVQ